MEVVIDILSKFKLISNSENYSLECKEASNLAPKSMWETYSAFANTSGGIILLGVKENGDKSFSVTGVSSPYSVVNDILVNLGNRNKVSVNLLNNENIVVVKDISGNNVIVIQVPEAEENQKPVYINGKIEMSFIRQGECDQKVSNSLLQSMLRNASSSLDSGIQTMYSIRDIDPIALASFKSIVSARYEDKNYSNLSDEQFLFELGLFRRNRSDGRIYPTFGSILMLGKYNSIRDLVPSFHLDYIDYRDTEERWSDRVSSDVPGLKEMNIYNFFSIVLDKLMATIKAQFSLGNNNVRSDKTLDIALREALVNTMVHADYLMPGEYIKIEVYEGWYSFRNPGKMLVSENDYACGGVSKVRNEILMKCFRLLGFAERQGMGGREIVTTAMSLNLRQPDIDTSFSYTNLVFWKTDLVDSHDELSKNEKIVFSYIINNKTASKREIVNACPSISDRQIRSVLESLQSRNLVKLSGKGPAARYCLHEQSPEKKVQIQKEIYSLLQFIRS